MACAGAGQTLPPAYNASSGGSFANAGNSLLNIASFPAVAAANCNAGELASVKITRDGDGTAGLDDLASSFLLAGAEIRFTRSLN
jgi:hypothetical protein